ncbi:hypothetical protein [Pedobacter montanisoli]|uniref:DUF4369 domain-containing protein n=1 Tax=Pedobacter montanisoli TaxID=2923277 RepID=A0ABS9ZSD2_9SPHI|nr:hypothetical protein [Pedobacter montanisoli]MCJ0741481.1 hypothetical protein [Pedobacter montanisoli]
MKKHFLLLYILLSLIKLVNAQPGQIHIKYVNMPFLMVERYSFFKEDPLIKVEKESDNNFVLTYYGDKPRLYNINFRNVLISPGDTVKLLHEKLELDQNSRRDTLIATGKNLANYLFSNKELDFIPKEYHPDYKAAKFKNNTLGAFKALKESRDRFETEVKAYLERIQCNKDLKGFLVRRNKMQLYYDFNNMMNMSGNDISQKALVSHLRDSLFNNMTFVESDTAYNYSMEILFNNHFKFLITDQFNSLRTEKDFEAVVTYIAQYPKPFIKDYFVYFLNTDYNYAVSNYKNKIYEELLNKNPYIGRIRNKILDPANVYK